MYTIQSSSVHSGSRTPHYLGWRQWHPQSNQDLTIVKGFLGSLLVCQSVKARVLPTGTHAHLEDSANGLDIVSFFFWKVEQRGNVGAKPSCFAWGSPESVPEAGKAHLTTSYFSLKHKLAASFEFSLCFYYLQIRYFGIFPRDTQTGLDR